MLPILLQLHNFMCYREDVDPIRFDSFRIACICGENGNGKSALLDAITWALWGKARAKSDDELIHQGRDEMGVEFEFDLESNRYRILRKRHRGGLKQRGQTVLELQVKDSGRFRSISGNSVGETQQKIIRLLRMDYPTFVNSAYLRQGHADEFTLKQPSERKKVLADILGLSFYDELEERARKCAREKEGQKESLQRGLAGMEQEIGRRDEYEIEYAHLKEVLAGLERDTEERKQKIILLRDERKVLDIKQQQLADWEERIIQSKKDLDYWQRQVEEHSHRIEEYNRLLGRRAEIEKGYEQLQNVRGQIEELNIKLEKWADLTQHRGNLEQAISKAEQTLATEQRLSEKRLQELQLELARKPQLEKELDQVQSRLQQLEEQEGKLEERKQELHEVMLRIQHLKSDAVKLKDEASNLQVKLALFRNNSTGQEGIRCPLCEVELGVEGKRRIEQKYRAELQNYRESWEKSEMERREAENRQQWLSREVGVVEGLVRKERPFIQKKLATLENELSHCNKVPEDIDEELKRLAELERRLKQGDFASAEHYSLAETERQIAELGYETKQHQQLQQLLRSLEQYDSLKYSHGEAEKCTPAEKEALTEAKEGMSWSSEAMGKLNQQKAALLTEIAALPEVARKLSELERSYNELQQCCAQFQKNVGVMQQKLAYCDELERSKVEKKHLLELALKEKRIYDELIEAFGKKGIQAFIIESVIPEIENEANRLLTRMTDNRMHVKIETQREAKSRKGETIETLDIKISDELGIRNYEMYSGGEAFRIDFAIRVALSRLLARRAGAPLTTLFIDEGFGTQDNQGLDKLIGAINSIADEFDKILVITHLEELKDAFPVRIDVIKTAEGSAISVG